MPSIAAPSLSEHQRTPMSGKRASAHDPDPDLPHATNTSLRHYNQSTRPHSSIPSKDLLNPAPTPTALQSHVLFWDRDGDNIITPSDVYTGFRALGFSIPFSLGSFLIPLFFSYPTRLAYSWLPDPFFRIYISSIHKAKHGSDTGIYDNDGRFRPLLFEELFRKFDGSGTGSLSYEELGRLIAKDRCAADPAGWSFAFMEWWTTWLLLQREGRVWKEDLRQCYDGSLFWRIREERAGLNGWRQGYGWKDFFQSYSYGGTWKEWKLR